MATTNAALPAKPEVLRWARHYAYLTLGEATNEIGDTPTKLEELEWGKAGLDHQTLVAMSNAHQLSESVLLLPTPPPVREFPKDFRQPHGANQGTPISRKTATMSRQVQELQSFVSDLVNDERELIRHFESTKAMTDDDPEKIAVMERERVGAPIEAQQRWPTKEAFQRWRRVVETAGTSAPKILPVPLGSGCSVPWHRPNTDDSYQRGRY